MRSKNTLIAVVEEFMLANPHVTQNRTIAKLLVGKYPMLFKGIEHAREVVRFAIGKRGSAYTTIYTKPFVEKLEAMRANIIPQLAELPDTSPFVIPNYEKILVISDLHIPLTDMNALMLALEYGYNKGAEAIVINGDFMDFTTISRFIHIPTEMTVKESLEVANNILDEMQKLLEIPIIYHYGNHCERLDTHVLMKSPELWGMAGMTLQEQLKLKERGIPHVSGIRHMKYGGLNIAHGHNIVKGVFAPVNPARGVFTKTGVSTLIGHCHRTSEHIEPNMNGKVIGCFSTGCITSVNPVYNAQVSKHNQGFAMVELLYDEGDFIVDNRKIIDYKVR